MLESLKAATFEVLETMFYIFPEDPEEKEKLLRGAGLRAWVPVRGPKKFRVGLSVPLNLAREMAANFLGLDREAVTPEQLRDVVKETANMVAGALLAREQAPKIYQLESPQVVQVNLEESAAAEQPGHILLAVEDSGIEIFMERVK